MDETLNFTPSINEHQRTGSSLHKCTGVGKAHLPIRCTLQHVGQAAGRGRCVIKLKCFAESGQNVDGLCSKGSRDKRIGV